MFVCLFCCCSCCLFCFMSFWSMEWQSCVIHHYVGRGGGGQGRSGSFPERKEQYSYRILCSALRNTFLDRLICACFLLFWYSWSILGSVLCYHPIFSKISSSFVNCNFRDNFIVIGGFCIFSMQRLLYTVQNIKKEVSCCPGW